MFFGFTEDLLFDGHLFEDGFEQQLAVREVGVVQGRVEEAEEVVGLLPVHAALLDLFIEFAPDVLGAFVEVFLLDVLHDDLDAQSFEEQECELGSHESRADEPDLEDGDRLGFGAADLLFYTALDKIEAV